MLQSLDEVPTACTTIEEVGSTGVGALTVAFLILTVATIIFLVKSWSTVEQKPYYVCATYMCGFGSMAYFAMLSGQGWTAIAGCRQFFYARYADWFVSFPLLVLLLGIVGQADWASIGAGIGSIGLVGLGGGLVSITRTFKVAAQARGLEIEQLYGKMAWLTFLVWLIYPLIWLFSEGFASFSVSFEVCAYAVADIMSKVVVSFILLSGNDVLGQAAAKEFV